MSRILKKVHIKVMSYRQVYSRSKAGKEMM